MPDQITKPLKREVKRGGELILFDIKKDAPKLSGDLAAAAHMRVSNDGLGVSVGYSPRGVGFKRKWKEGGYKALWHEFGTVKMPATPFVGPAFTRNLATLKRNIQRAINATLRRGIRG